MNTPRFREGLFLSDLHLFCPRHEARATAKRQVQEFNAADKCVVLGGDIFDFRWSDLGGLQQSLEAAKVWMEEFLESTHSSQIVYLLGNHDCHPGHVENLRRLEEQTDRFELHEHHLQMEDCLFLHGDILDASLHIENLDSYRSAFHEAEPRAQWQQRAYNVAVGFRMHKVLVGVRNSPQLTCKRLKKAIDDSELAEPGSVKRVYFGHTHHYCSGTEIDGMQFFNPGAQLRHLTFNAHHFHLDPTE